MPLSYEIDDRAIRITWDGPFDGEGDSETLLALLSDDRLRPGLDMISDQTGLERPADKERVQGGLRFLEMIYSRIGRFSCAIIVQRDVSFGMGRMAESLKTNDDIQVRTFRSIVEAEAWLRGESE